MARLDARSTVEMIPDRSLRNPRDMNQMAAAIVESATCDEPRPGPDESKNPAAVAVGRP